MSTTGECETAAHSDPAARAIENKQHTAQPKFEPLYLRKSPNIHRLEAGATGNVNDDKTNAPGSVDAPWPCDISHLYHYRLAYGVVGRALCKFKCTKELVTAVFDALLAHSHAHDTAKILHRDVSAGNILLTDDGKGLLIDWELAKRVEEDGSRRRDHTGTWQFMSANLLRHPGKMHTLTDDLESFLHVIGWVTLRHVPAIDSYGAVRRGKDMAMFDEHYEEEI